MSPLATASLALLLSAEPARPPGGPAPAGSHTPTKAEIKRFRAAVAEGDRAERKGDHARAIAAFERALAARPDHARVLSDLGWAALQMHDLDRAERSTRKAIEAASATSNFRIEAAAHYNLGRILEERGKKPEAVEAYQRSLELRPSRTVREQLGKLDPAAAAAADPLRPHAMQGPFATLAAYCRSLEEKEERESCSPEDKGQLSVTQGKKPFLEARFLTRGESSAVCVLAARTAQGWYVDDLGECQDGSYLQERPLSLALTDLVPGGGAELVLRFTQQERQLEDVDDPDTGPRMAWVGGDCDGRQVICGVGRGAAPTCISFVAAQSSDCGSEGEPDWIWRLTPVFTADGQVDVTATGKPNAEAKAVMGKRPIAFP